MKSKVMVFAVLLAAPAAAAAQMPVSTFLAKAEALKAKGPLAIFSGDVKLLMRQVKADAAELRAENKSLEAGGRTKAYCAPAAGVKMGSSEVMTAMQSVPAPQRARTTTKAALRTYFARRFPCRG